MASQTEPGRNNRLNRAAFSLGQFVGAGVLDESTVTYMLMGAAARCGVLADDGERQTRATIESGLRDGIKEPRELIETTETSTCSSAPETLSLAYWLDRDLPEPDLLMGEWLSTTSRT